MRFLAVLRGSANLIDETSKWYALCNPPLFCGKQTLPPLCHHAQLEDQEVCSGLCNPLRSERLPQMQKRHAMKLTWLMLSTALAAGWFGNSQAQAAHCGACSYPADPICPDQCAMPEIKTRISYKPVYETHTETCYREVYHTVMEQERYTVCRSVYETCVREERYCTQRAVSEYYDVQQRQIVNRPVYEQHMRECRYTVQRPVFNEYQVQVPYTTYHPVYEQHVRSSVYNHYAACM